MDESRAQLEVRLERAERAIAELRALCERLASEVASLKSKPVREPENRPVPPPECSPPAPPPPAPEGPPVAGEAKRTVLLICLDDAGEVPEAIREAAKKVPGVEVAIGEQALERSDAAKRVFVANLLAKAPNPLLALASAADWGVEPARAFLYGWEDGSGSAIGIVDLFPPPFDPAACAKRLTSQYPEPPSVLLVSEHFDAMLPLQDELRRAGATAAVACNLRQAMDLARMTDPDVLLIDLGLPRAEGVRTALRLTAGGRAARLRLGFLWHGHLPWARFRDEVRRALRESRAAAPVIAAELVRHLAPGGRLFGG